VLVLTDLGIQKPQFGIDWASPAEWSQFARQVRQAQCPLTAFVPYSRTRWPRGLARLFTILTWDRFTTVSVARSAVARVHRRGGRR
jgi:hypothetical protein